MAKDNKNEQKSKKKLLGLNNLFNQSIDDLSSNIYGTDNRNQRNLNQIVQGFDEIIRTEINNTKSITSSEMSTFIVKLFNEFDKTEKNNIKSINDIFENDEAGLFQFFQQRYQNQNLLYEDLNMIKTQLAELKEAVLSFRDAIVTADDISNEVSRTLTFNNLTDSPEKQASYVNTIEVLERKTKLLTKIKNQIVPNTLTYGKYYVYVCPYSKLFQEQYDKKQKDVHYMSDIRESIDRDFLMDLKTTVKESIDSTDKTNKYTVTDKSLTDSVNNIAKDIKVINDCVSIPLIEGADLSELVDSELFRKTRDKYVTNLTPTTSDGLVDLNSGSKKKSENFDQHSGCYTRYIDPRQMIPVKILDTTIGYYYVHGTDFQVNKSPFSTTITVTNINGGSGTYQNTEEIETVFLSKITDKIVKAFDKKFLENNVKFKELILNALMYNDLYKREIRFQFIPAEYVVEFNINEDENGEGQSILKDSLFYAKLYLALLVFKMISIVTKSNDTRVYYIKNSGIDQNMTNKVQEVARSIKGRQINFMDLLNYNSIISKIGQNKELFIPAGRNGERGIEFDILSGQDIPLNTDLMEMLHQNMINSTGCPSVIMNYINEADFARTLVMSNAKFLGRSISLQIDLNEPITALYKLLIKYSNVGIPDNAIDAFEFKFNTPKTLNTTNLGDLINNTDVVVNAAIKASTGENADQSNDDNRIKDKLYNRLFRKYLPMIDWDMVDTELRNARLEIAQEDADLKAKPSDTNNSNTEGY